MRREQVLEEEPLPQLERPVVVKDEMYTKIPTTDRGVLAKCMEDLAKSVRDALTDDARKNRRYARRLKIDNRIRHTEGKRREEYPVMLPIAATCWNDVDILELEFRMITAIAEAVKSYTHLWYHVRALFDDFIDPQTKLYLDRLDRGESLSPEPESQQQQQASTTTTAPRPGPSRAAGDRVGVRISNGRSSNLSPSTSKDASPRPSTSRSTDPPHVKGSHTVAVNVDSSEDEEVMILN